MPRRVTGRCPGPRLRATRPRGSAPGTPPGDQSPGPHPASHDSVGCPPDAAATLRYPRRSARPETPSAPPSDRPGVARQSLRRPHLATLARLSVGATGRWPGSRGRWPIGRGVGWTSTSDTTVQGSGIRGQGSGSRGGQARGPAVAQASRLRTVAREPQADSEQPRRLPHRRQCDGRRSASSARGRLRSAERLLRAVGAPRSPG